MKESVSFINYKNGFKHGLSKLFYDSGILNMECSYLNGLKHGPATFYYRSTIMESTGFYNMGRKDSIWDFYDDMGKFIQQINYTDSIN